MQIRKALVVTLIFVGIASTALAQTARQWEAVGKVGMNESRLDRKGR